MNLALASLVSANLATANVVVAKVAFANVVLGCVVPGKRDGELGEPGENQAGENKEDRVQDPAYEEEK